MITLCPMKVFSKREGTKKKELRCSRLRRSQRQSVIWLRRIVIPTAPELIHGASSSGHKFGDRGHDDGADVAYP